MKHFYPAILLLSFVFMSTPTPAAENDLRPDQAKESSAEHYKIGANDVLNIFVWKEPELTQDVIVMSDGRITFPMIGEIMAEGRTVTELKDNITEKLIDYISTPEVTVILKQSLSRRIYAIGQLKQPGQYQLQPDMTVLQALAAAGGFTEWGDKKNVLVVRKNGDQETLYRFNYQEFIGGGNLSQNIELEPNDTIVVP